MKLLFKHILIILVLMAFLPNWIVGQNAWVGGDGIVTSGTFHFIDGGTGHQFLCPDWPPNNTTVFSSIGSFNKKGAGLATLYIQTSHTIDLSGTITVTEGELIIQLNGQILAKTGAGRVATINGGKLTIRDAAPDVEHEGKTYRVAIGDETYSYTHDNIWQEYAGGDVVIKGGIIVGGRPAVRNNGGCFLVKAGGTLSIEGGTLAGHVSGFNGGAVYLEGASGNKANFNMSGGSICYNAGVSGGGVMAFHHTTFTMTGGSISNNVARDWGKANGGNGGAVYCGTDDVSIAIKQGEFIDNKAMKNDYNQGGTGGAFSLNASGPPAEFGESGPVLIQYNTSDNGGGGICAQGATSITFMNGNVTIDGNSSNGDGGGICCGNIGGTSPNLTRLRICGATITNNKAGSGKKGGGIYDNETYINFGGTAPINVHSNMVGDVPNDIYINDHTITVENSTIRPVKVGIYKTGSGDLPFFYSGSGTTVLQTVYNKIVSGEFHVFSNRTQYWKVKAYPESKSNNNLFFTIPWSSTQQGIALSDLKPNSSGVYEISNVKELTAFLCLVNGITTNSVDFGLGDMSANGKLMADINMYNHYWVPMGNVTGYKGTFDGNGYCISNLKVEGDNPTNEHGMFGQLASGCTVKNLQLHSCDISITRTAGPGAGGWAGGIASRLMGGTIYNCVVDGTVAGVSATHMGGIVGTIYSGAVVHSCSAMVSLSGSVTMGGLTGNLHGTLRNSFANTSLTRASEIGGLVGRGGSTGKISNCYVRNSNSLVGTSFEGTVSHCYGPSGTATTGSPGTYTNNGTYTNPVAPYLYTRTNDNMVGSSSLLALLNANRESGDAEWKRTSAGGYTGGGNINGDFPIHKYSNYKCVASTNGTNLCYANKLDDMLTRYISNTTINLYANDKTTKGTGSGVVVYIDENVSLLQDNVGSSYNITAYTCQTIPSGHNWHFISSSLSNSGIGFNYGITTQVGFNWSENPCNVTFSSTDNEALFPHDVPNINKVDLYAFYEPEYHWINLKRNSNSHWHMNATTVPINYHNGVSLGNETTLIPGKGYLASIDKEQLLQNKGTLNNGDVEATLGYSPHQAWAGLVGYNLIGNPYQSYLDFSKFAAQNSSLWYDNSEGKAVEPTYAVYDEAMGGYIQYKEGASRGSKSAPGILNMHQGFMVRSSGATSAKFTNDMRTHTAGTGFREEQPAFPLVNLTVTDDEGVNDIAVLELGRDANAGAEKLRANDCNGWLYLHYNDDDYGILFRSEVDDYQPLWFEASEAGTYTLSWETANAEFESLTLVDNITGVVTDMLTHDSYVFEANPEQYKSRFKIVVGDWKDVEDNEAPEPVEGPTTFAYYFDGEIHLVGADACDASLQIVDMMGRVITCRDAARHVSTAGMTPGVYILRLTDNNGTRTQKIILE